MQFQDAAKLSSTRKTKDGFLIAEAFTVRTGIQTYTGDEVGKPDLGIVRVYRPEEEVRSVDSMKSFSHAPITVGHPKGGVNDSNWRNLAVGEVSTEAVWDGNKIKLPLIVKDADTINQIESGTRELSAGYNCQLEWADGVTEDGEKYDAIQRNIRINHVAIVPRGRAGSECRIGDADNWGAVPVNTEKNHMTMKHVVVGRDTVQVADSDSTRLERFISDMESTHQAEIATKDAEIATKDRELATKDKEIADLQKKVLSDADLDKRVASRAKLIEDARAIDPKLECAGLSDADIRKKAVLSIRKDAVDRPAAYMDAMFDLLADEAKKTQKNFDPAMQTRVVGDQLINTNDAQDLGESARESALMDAWKTKE